MGSSPSSIGSENSAQIDSVLERRLGTRLKFWAILAGLPLLSLLGLTILLLAFQMWQIRQLKRELQSLKAEAVRLGQPIEIYNPAWGTVLDAVDPSRIPSRDARDPRYGALIQQYTPRGNGAQSWRLRTPSTRNGPEAPLAEQDYIKHAFSFVRARDYDRAVQAYQFCLTHYPDSAAAHNGLATALRDKGSFPEALQSHNRAVELAPTRPDLLWERAITRLRAGDLDGAIKDCESAVEKNPGLADAYNTMGIACRTQQAYAKALPHHDRAIELNPQREDFWRERALTHQANGDQQKSAADIERARQLRESPR
jgi:tetratricopeptide (TPR) repeat protein